MARTNKMWILKKKQQQAKQKILIWWKIENTEWIKKEYTNPNGNSFLRFFRSWKLVCDNTSVREDPDWFRIIRNPNWWEISFKENLNSWWYKKYIKSKKRIMNK
jgi:hypothetical protein